MLICIKCNTLKHTATRCNTPQHTQNDYLIPTRLTVLIYADGERNTHCNTHCNTQQHCSTQQLATQLTRSNLCKAEFLFENECPKTPGRVHLQNTATHCITLQHTASHCITLQHTATHSKCLPDTHAANRVDLRRRRIPGALLKILKSQLAATHCKTLQHTATHCRHCPLPGTLSETFKNQLCSHFL